MKLRSKRTLKGSGFDSRRLHQVTLRHRVTRSDATLDSIGGCFFFRLGACDSRRPRKTIRVIGSAARANPKLPSLDRRNMPRPSRLRTPSCAARAVAVVLLAEVPYLVFSQFPPDEEFHRYFLDPLPVLVDQHRRGLTTLVQHPLHLRLRHRAEEILQAQGKLNPED